MLSIQLSCYTQCLLFYKFHKDNQSSENQGAVKDSEIRQLVLDLTTIEPVVNDDIVVNGEYETNIIDDKISMKIAERKVLERVVLDNTQKASYYVQNRKGKKKEQKIKIIPRFSEIIIRRKSLTYVPKWIITIKAGKRIYKRKVLAASKTVILDEIYFCPKHFSFGKIWSMRKQTSAVCEICGGAFCDDHIFKINDTYYCEKHRSTELIN
jgi:hypothetical protein